MHSTHRMHEGCCKQAQHARGVLSDISALDATPEVLSEPVVGPRGVDVQDAEACPAPHLLARDVRVLPVALEVPHPFQLIQAEALPLRRKGTAGLQQVECQ